MDERIVSVICQNEIHRIRVTPDHTVVALDHNIRSELAIRALGDPSPLPRCIRFLLYLQGDERHYQYYPTTLRDLVEDISLEHNHQLLASLADDVRQRVLAVQPIIPTERILRFARYLFVPTYPRSGALRGGFLVPKNGRTILSDGWLDLRDTFYYCRLGYSFLRLGEVEP